MVQQLCHDLAQLSQKFYVQSMVGLVSHHMASGHPGIAILCQQCQIALQTCNELAEGLCKHDSGTGSIISMKLSCHIFKQNEAATKAPRSIVLSKPIRIRLQHQCTHQQVTKSMPDRLIIIEADILGPVPPVPKADN